MKRTGAVASVLFFCYTKKQSAETHKEAYGTERKGNTV